ncbi:MAG: T9SS type A sorting domain-containing protein, partial [Chryseobacterium sp.]
KKKCVLAIYSMQGQLQQQVVIKSTLQQISLSRLPQGVYVLYGKNDQGAEVNVKFVKR